MTTFGPQLIGETEKTLNALLRRALAGTGLDERQWVALRLAAQPDGTALRSRVSDRARFDDADELVSALEHRQLVARQPADRRRARDTGTRLRKSAALSGPIWDDIDDADAAARALDRGPGTGTLRAADHRLDPRRPSREAQNVNGQGRAWRTLGIDDRDRRRDQVGVRHAAQMIT